MWVGDPARNIAPWRDTGVELRGKAVEEAERAFQHVWAMLGERIPNEERPNTDKPTTLGDTSVRVVPSMPATAGMLRLDELVAALARNRLWLTDAYFAGTTSYIQGLRAAARDGIDVRLLVPNATDVRALKLLSRAGYRPLLEAGVRVFEWNGTMLHAKTAVADSRWSRVGSTNLNIASWFGNCELDVVVEDEAFAKEMEEMYLQDLKNATEVILDERNKVRAPGEPLHPQPIVTSGGGSASRAAAGAVRIGNAVGAAFVNRRVFEPVDARIMLIVGALFFGLAILLVFYPGALIKPVIVLFVWFGLALLYKACRLRWGRKQNVWNPADLNRPTGGG